ncbi:hypothetical protein [Gimesia algae]|uniref:Lipoprotein n=1 Tax=Gimesia algae TaxID=2527971 RepID=A0A517V679_9PLAN|nr:hypothetical protein [Gimesia algae]QDT88511.1 hypothetical protein Pan161_01270 [Gimesia algae]
MFFLRRNSAQKAFWLMLSVCLLCASISGCATTPYVYQPALIESPEPLLAAGEPQIVRGKRRPVIDGIGWVVGVPGKVLLWNRRVDNHNVSPETEAAIAAYLEKNGLEQVKVRVNEYDPLGEWKRLRKNKAVGWGWRYTAGTLTALSYTLLPGRIIGGDNYNPFTNTISLYSDLPAVALHEGGHAKDFGTRKYKGTYAVAGALPVVSLWPEAIATNDALGYLRAEEDFETEEEAYRVLYPAYATYIAGAATPFLPYADLAVKAGTVIPAHLVGRWKAREVKQEQLARYARSELQQVSATQTEQLPEQEDQKHQQIQQAYFEQAASTDEPKGQTDQFVKPVNFNQADE